MKDKYILALHDKNMLTFKERLAAHYKNIIFFASRVWHVVLQRFLF